MRQKSKTLFLKFPESAQWAQFFNVLSKKQRQFFILFFCLAVISAVYLNLNYFYSSTTVLPDFGGEYKEGVVGQPRFINPLYLSDNDPDRDLVEIMFSGLLKYNENGELVKDLAESYELKENGKSYEFALKENVFWHNGEKLTSDDVVFTVELIQLPQYKSPLRIEWSGIKIEKINERKVVFHLQKSYFSFLENVAHLKILPKHIFQDISPDNFPWTLSYSKYLIGSGPFKIKEIKRESPNEIKKIILERNEKFYDKKPFLKELVFSYYKSSDEVLLAARTGEVDGFSASNPKYLKSLEKEGLKPYRLSLPRYFALFFNLENSNILKDKDTRKALAYTVNKNELLETVFLGEGEIVNSPILCSYYALNEPKEIPCPDIEKAKEILQNKGFKENPETGYREKLVIKNIPQLFKVELKKGDEGREVKELQKCLARDTEIYPEAEITGYFGAKTQEAVIEFQEKYAAEVLYPIGLKHGTGKVGAMTRDKLNLICQELPKEIVPLKLTLTTFDKFPLIEMAELLKTQFKAAGIELAIKTVSLSDLQIDILAKRDFEILLFGQALGSLPDPFSFWHSSQKEYPGLNISGFSSKQADQLLETARESLDEKKRKQSLEEFQNILLAEAPAVFLARGNYFYFLSPEIKGFTTRKITEPAKRFIGIENRYINTYRVWQ